jgi:hypothetical protein
MTTMLTSLATIIPLSTCNACNPMSDAKIIGTAKC